MAAGFSGPLFLLGLGAGGTGQGGFRGARPIPPLGGITTGEQGGFIGVIPLVNLAGGTEEVEPPVTEEPRGGAIGIAEDENRPIGNRTRMFRPIEGPATKAEREAARVTQLLLERTELQEVEARTLALKRVEDKISTDVLSAYTKREIEALSQIEEINDDEEALLLFTVAYYNHYGPH